MMKGKENNFCMDDASVAIETLSADKSIPGRGCENYYDNNSEIQSFYQYHISLSISLWITAVFFYACFLG